MYERIISLCKEKGISIRQLETELGFSNGTFQHWKTSAPKVNKLMQVAIYFNVSLDELVGWVNRCREV